MKCDVCAFNSLVIKFITIRLADIKINLPIVHKANPQESWLPESLAGSYPASPALPFPSLEISGPNCVGKRSRVALQCKWLV